MIKTQFKTRKVPIIAKCRTTGKKVQTNKYLEMPMIMSQ